MQKINDAIEKLFHKKSVIKGVFIIPLITIVIIAVSLSRFIKANQSLPYIHQIEYLFTGILILLFFNAVANFAALILYYCLHNRVEELSKKYKKFL